MVVKTNLTQVHALLAVLAGGMNRKPVYWRRSAMESFLFPIQVNDQLSANISLSIDVIRGVPVEPSDYISAITSVLVSLEDTLKKGFSDDYIIAETSITASLKDVLNKGYSFDLIQSTTSINVLHYDGVSTLSDDHILASTSIEVTRT